ncbi:hypothetical protein [Methylobacterium sp. ID0610]|uniref:hypothetical protein n=1 Tax=Methylobacterium carpenticola TaxID=3344827 RepID=UPI0036A626C4
MGEAARDEGWHERAASPSNILQRLLLRPVPRAGDLEPDMDEAFAVAGDEDLEDAVSRLETENLVIKAALKSEQAEVADLRARLDALGDAETPQDLRVDRDRWATLVERLLFAGR